jgi:hypothetical protein
MATKICEKKKQQNFDSQISEFGENIRTANFQNE